MTKLEFLSALREKLSGLPASDIEERLEFYGEVIEDRIEEGLSEDLAVAQTGDPNEIAAQIIYDTPFAKIVKEKIRPKRKLSGFEVVLLILGSPIWLSLLICAFAVVLSIYICLWAVIVSLWAVFASFAGSAFGGMAAGVYFAVSGNAFSGLALIGAGLILAGLSVFTFYGCKAATKGVALLTKKIALWIKSYFVKKEVA